MRKITWMLFLITFLTVCKTDTITLKEGMRTLYYQQPDLMDPKTQTLVTLTAVQDARCPEDVTCIWAGYVTVNLEFDLRNLKKKQQAKLCFNCIHIIPGDTTTSATADIDLEGTKYRLSLQSVTPSPNVKTPPKKEDYQVTIQIDKL